jgi:hypothetical protein
MVFLPAAICKLQRTIQTRAVRAERACSSGGQASSAVRQEPLDSCQQGPSDAPTVGGRLHRSLVRVVLHVGHLDEDLGNPGEVESAEVGARCHADNKPNSFGGIARFTACRYGLASSNAGVSAVHRG